MVPRRHSRGRKRESSGSNVNAAGSPIEAFGDDGKIWRLLDANTNRAREGLRIIEDTARFVLSKPKAAKEIRTLRHGLDSLVRSHYKRLLAARDVTHDSGRANVSKPYKGGVEALLIANFKRCEEALRVLEEYGRVMSPGAVKGAQALRFRVYQWETKLLSNGSKKPAST